MTVIACAEPMLLHGFAGASSSAAAVEAEINRTLAAIKLGMAQRGEALNDLAELVHDHTLTTTDSGRRAVGKAIEFLIALQSDLRQPEVSLDPDGEIAFDWRTGHDLLSISLNGEGRAAYAWDIGGNADSGTAVIRRAVPASLVALIRHFGRS